MPAGVVAPDIATLDTAAGMTLAAVLFCPQQTVTGNALNEFSVNTTGSYRRTTLSGPINRERHRNTSKFLPFSVRFFFSIQTFLKKVFVQTVSIFECRLQELCR